MTSDPPFPRFKNIGPDETDRTKRKVERGIIGEFFAWVINLFRRRHRS